MKLSFMLVHDYYENADRSISELYWETIRQSQLAEKLGYHSVWIAEHHFSYYGVVPNPAVLLSYLAATTSTIKLGPSIVILPYHDPRTIAETYAMLDEVSRGRLQLGVGTGFQAEEYARYDVDFQARHQRFAESLSVIRQLLKGDHVSLEGTHYRLNNVRLNIAPVQRDVPIFIATNRPDGAEACGKQGLNVLCMPYAHFKTIDEVPHYIERFRTGREACGIAMEPESAQFGLHTYVGESKAEAHSTASQAFDRYIAVRTNAQRRSYEEIVSKGLALFGSADEVRDQLIHMVDLGATHLLTIQSFGLIADAKVQKSMERLSKSVLPSVLQHARSSKGNTSARVSEPIATARQA
jgi:alkanesulfonate monooxygenase SsuD/methylene tetrahydromethanopterin reductase-like flavin-dependent oxidoreductase (luciferase family)